MEYCMFFMYDFKEYMDVICNDEFLAIRPRPSTKRRFVDETLLIFMLFSRVINLLFLNWWLIYCSVFSDILDI